MHRSVTASRRRINYKLLERLEHPAAERLFKEIKKCRDRGWADPPVRYLAAQIRRSIRQTHRALQKLEAVGYVRHTQRRQSRTRCLTSVYEITGCIVVIGVIEKPKASNTTAPPSARWDNHPPAMRKLFDLVALRNAQLRSFRHSREDHQRLHMQALARVGMYTGPTMDEDTAEMLRRRLT